MFRNVIGRIFREICSRGIALGLGMWSLLALYYSDLSLGVKWLSIGAAVLCLGGAWFVRTRTHRLGIGLLVFFCVLTWWLHLTPSNDRQWQPDVMRLPTASVEGDVVTIHNIRNCAYRSETDYTVRYYDKQVRLSNLQGVDLFLVYWGSPNIAHTMLSFDFGDGSPVCFSIEARKTVDESYSAVAGFFRQYELMYVVGDERDLVRLRTNYRHEDVYLYRLTFNPLIARSVFLGYLRRINELAGHPEWYNAFLSNCTTNIRTLARPYTDDARWDWRMLVNGYVDEMAYERGMFNTAWSLEELRRRGHINDRAGRIGDSPDFSALIREDVPLAMPGSIVQDQAVPQ